MLIDDTEKLAEELREHADSFNHDGPCENRGAYPDLYRRAALQFALHIQAFKALVSMIIGKEEASDFDIDIEELRTIAQEVTE